MPLFGGVISIIASVLREGTADGNVLHSMGVIGNTDKSVFVCYAHADNMSPDPQKRWLDRLLEFLRPFVRQQGLETWSDQDIKIGDAWHERITEHLDRAKAVILMVSPAFLASDYIANSELPILLKHAADRKTPILPIIISPCLYESAKFKFPDPRTGPSELLLSSIQAANPPSRTLVEMNEGEQNRVFLRLSQQIMQLFGNDLISRLLDGELSKANLPENLSNEPFDIKKSLIDPL